MWCSVSRWDQKYEWFESEVYLKILLEKVYNVHKGYATAGSQRQLSCMLGAGSWGCHIAVELTISTWEPYFCYFSEQDKRAWISSRVWGNVSIQKLRNKANKEWHVQYNNWKSNNKEKEVKHYETVGIFLRIIRGW